MQKFAFSLKTRDGQPVDNIQIAARDRADAERKLRQMYYNCEILNCAEQHTEAKSGDAMSFEDIMGLISK